MAKVLFSGTWFDEVSPSAMYEADFERIVIREAPLLFPTFNVVPFKTTVYSEEGAARADLALIDKDYREWWVVEIERGDHSLEGHVLPQVRILSRAVYAGEEAEFLSGNAPALEVTRLSDMMKGRQPRVFVLVNAMSWDWVQPLKQYDAIVGWIEIFRSNKNEHLYRINGERPELRSEVVSVCHFDPLLPRFLILGSPSALGVGPHERITIYHGDRMTDWQRIDSRDMVWLSPIGPNPLSGQTSYEIVRQANGSLMFRPRETRSLRRP
jgi:hypothetical protein